MRDGKTKMAAAAAAAATDVLEVNAMISHHTCIFI